MNVEELNIAVDNLRDISTYIGNTIISLKSRGFVVNDSKYCKLRICQWLINTFNLHIFNEVESTKEEDVMYLELCNHVNLNN